MAVEDVVDTIEIVALSGLSEAPQNSRKHTEAQIDQIAASIERFGWTIPVLIDENGMIIAGHARVRAAKKLGITEAPCIRADGWNADKKEAYQITDNRLSELSEWDEDVLKAQIKRLNAAQFDLGFLDMSGFDIDLFKPILAPDIKVGDVTGEAIQKSQEQQSAKFEGGDKEAYEIVCPHCGQDIEVTL